MKLIVNKLRVEHRPQIPCEPFIIEVKDEIEANKIIDVLANQHLFLLDKNIIPDYSNIISVSMFVESEHEKGGNWEEYFNEEELMDWEEFVEIYLENI